MSTPILTALMLFTLACLIPTAFFMFNEIIDDDTIFAISMCIIFLIIISVCAATIITTIITV